MNQKIEERKTKNRRKIEQYAQRRPRTADIVPSWSAAQKARNPRYANELPALSRKICSGSGAVCASPNAQNAAAGAGDQCISWTSSPRHYMKFRWICCLLRLYVRIGQRISRSARHNLQLRDSSCGRESPRPGSIPLFLGASLRFQPQRQPKLS